MRKASIWLAAGCAALLFVACGDDDDDGPGKEAGTKLDKGIKKDGAKLDTGTVIEKDTGVKKEGSVAKEAGKTDGKPKADTTPVGKCDGTKVGKQCAEDADCGEAPNMCVGLDPSLPGFCSCACTVDDPATDLFNEDSCPGKTSGHDVCVNFPGTTDNYCFQTCTPNSTTNACDGELACDFNWTLNIFSDWYSDPATNPNEKILCLPLGCSADADCQVLGLKCKVSANPTTCSTGFTCLPAEQGSDDGYCVGEGTCNTTTHLCTTRTKNFKAAAKVGDPCNSDLDCGADQSCFSETDTSEPGKPGLIWFRNGYCTIIGCKYASTLKNVDCGADSTCNKLYTYSFCQKKCDITKAEECRGHTDIDRYGDYECWNWSNLDAQFGQWVATPVCDFALIFDAEYLSTGMGVTCDKFGGTGNPTHYGTYDLTGAVKTTPTASTFCLDDTKCSDIKRGTPAPDASVPKDSGLVQ